MKRSTLARAALIAGIVLVVAALGLTGYNLLTEELAGQERDVILSELDELLPALDGSAALTGEGEAAQNAPTFEEIKTIDARQLWKMHADNVRRYPVHKDEPKDYGLSDD